MPTYQYACTACDEQLEAVQRFTDNPLTDCPSCSGRLRKVFSPVGIVFRGSGFYKTDSRSGAGRSSTAGKDKPATSTDAQTGTAAAAPTAPASPTPPPPATPSAASA